MNNQMALAKPKFNSAPVLRFDIFRGVAQSDGAIVKIKSVGVALLREPSSTYTLLLNMFVNDAFYLVPARKSETSAEYVIMTRSHSPNPKKRYIWRAVGEAHLIENERGGAFKLSWDLFPGSDIYMSLHPKPIAFEKCAVIALKQVLKTDNQ